MKKLFARGAAIAVLAAAVFVPIAGASEAVAAPSQKGAVADDGFGDGFGHGHGHCGTCLSQLGLINLIN